MADPKNSSGHRPTQDDPIRAMGNRASQEQIEVVSRALMAGKSLLDRPPSPTGINPPEADRRPIRLASPTSHFDDHSTTLDPARVDLPEGSLADESKGVEPPRIDEVGLPKTTGDRPSGSVEPSQETTRAGRSIPSESLPVRTSAVADPIPALGGGSLGSLPGAKIDRPIEGSPGTPDRPEVSTVLAARSSLSTTVPASSGSLHGFDGIAESQARPDAGPEVVHAGQPEPPFAVGVERPSDRPGARVSAKVAAVSSLGLPQDTEGLKVSGLPVMTTGPNLLAGVAPSGSSADSPSRSSNPAESSMTFVRNPLSSGLRNFAISGPTLPGQGDSTSDPGGIGKGPGDPASGGPTTASASPQAGGSGDLSRTNELLQQLIDAVRKQRGSSLPPGGPSVYPDR
jgi:hypothetical protein